MRTMAMILMFTITIIWLCQSRAQQAPGPSSTKPIVPVPQGKAISTNAPPIAYLHTPHTINVAPDVAITITSTNVFTVGQARQWLRQAMMNPLK